MPSSSTRSVDGSDGNISPDSYELKEVIFHSNARKRIDIKAYIQKIELFENINSPFIEAVVSIQDASSFFEQQNYQKASQKTSGEKVGKKWSPGALGEIEARPSRDIWDPNSLLGGRGV